MEQCVRDSQASLRKAGTVKRAKSVFQQRNLGTIRSAKKDKKKASDPTSSGNADIILRILRMRCVSVILLAGFALLTLPHLASPRRSGGAAVQEFIAEQIAFKDVILKQASEAASRPQPLKRPSNGGKAMRGGSGGDSLSIPPVPSLPAIPALVDRKARGFQLRDG